MGCRRVTRSLAGMAVLAVLVLAAGCSSSSPSAKGSDTSGAAKGATSTTTKPGANPSIITTQPPVTKPQTIAEKCEAEVQAVKTAALAYNVADEHVSSWPRSVDDFLFDPREEPLRGGEWMSALPAYVVVTGDGTAPPTISWKPDAPTECTSANIDLSLTL